MQALGVAANVFGVITPAKDLGEIVKAIADSVDNVKRNKYKVSSLMKSLKVYVERLHKARARCEQAGATREEIQSISDLQRSLIIVWKELAELKQSQSYSGLFGSTFAQWWNVGGIKTKIEQLEMDIRQCQDLFLFDSQHEFRQEMNDRFDSLNSMMNTIISSNGDSRSRRSRNQMQRTTIMWKIPTKADFNSKAVNYAYLQNKVYLLLNALKNNGVLVQQLFRNNGGYFDVKLAAGVPRHLPVGDPTTECEDASNFAVQLTRAIQKEDSSIVIVDLFDELSRLATILYDVGLRKESQRVWQFENYLLTSLASGEGSTVDTYLAHCLHNLATSYSDEGRKDVAVALFEKAVEIERRLGKPFIATLAYSLRSLSDCFRILGQPEKAAETLQESFDICQQLASDDPLQYGWQMAKYLMNEGFLRYNIREYQKAIDISEEAILWMSKSSSRFKDNFAQTYAYARFIAAASYKELGNYEKAEEYMREATKMNNKLIYDRPSFYLTISLAIAFSSWFRESDRCNDAINILEESLTLYCSVEPSSVIQQKFTDTLQYRAEIQYSKGNFDDASDTLLEVIDVRHHLLEEDDTNMDKLLGLLSTFRLRSSCLISMCRQLEAIKSIEAALDTLHASIKKVELNEDQIDKFLKLLLSLELELKKICSTEGFNNSREYKRAAFRVDEAIIVFRQRSFCTW